jgi:large subunit ribosomal protein L12
MGGKISMEYIYSALLLHSAGKKISEDSVKKVMTAAGAKPNASRVKALVAALEGVDIKEAIEKAVPAAAPVAQVAAPAAGAPAEEKKEEKEEEKEEVSEEQAAAGLGALFG